MKRSEGKLKGKKRNEERAQFCQQTTLAQLLTLIDGATNDAEISVILDRLSPGARALLYSALLFTQPSPHSAEQPTNRSFALDTLRELLL